MLRLFSRKRTEQDTQPIKRPRVDDVPELCEVTEGEAKAYSEIFNFPYEEGVTSQRIRNLVFGFRLKHAVRDIPYEIVGPDGTETLLLPEEMQAAGFMYGIRGARSVPVIYLMDSKDVFNLAQKAAMSYREKLGLPRQHQI